MTEGRKGTVGSVRWMRFVRSAVLVLLAVFALAAVSSAAASALRPLSAAEYQQLQRAQDRIRSLETSDGGSFQRANSVCTRMRGVTMLIAAVRNGCLALIRLSGDDAKLSAQETKCGINPASQAAILTCLVPAVERYYRDADAFYRAESTVAQLARARGFSSACIAVLGGSRGNVAAEGKLADDLRQAVQALRKQDPQALQVLPGQIRAAVRAIKPGPRSLSLCPHR